MKKSTELVPVAARDLQIIEYRGQRVVTTEQLAAGYGATPIRIRQNHSRNEERFVVGKHYFLLEGDELRELKHRVSQSYSVKIASNVRSLILWTERGAANHAKLLETDQAWNYHEDLVEFYFTQRENIDVQRVLTRKELALMVIEAEERAEAMALENKTLSATVDSLEKHLHDCSPVLPCAERRKYQPDNVVAVWPKMGIQRTTRSGENTPLAHGLLCP